MRARPLRTTIGSRPPGPPPASGGAGRAAPALCRRNSSWGTEAGERGGGTGQSPDAPGRTEPWRPCCPSPDPGAPRGPGWGAARAPAGTELEGGDRPRAGAAFGGRSLPPGIPPGMGVGVGVAGPRGLALGVPAHRGAQCMGPSGRGRRVCLRSFLRRGFCLEPLWGTVSLFPGGIWGCWWAASAIPGEKGFLCPSLLLWLRQPKGREKRLLPGACPSSDPFTSFLPGGLALGRDLTRNQREFVVWISHPGK